MLNVLFQLPYFWINIWSAPADQVAPMYVDYVMSTFIVLLPFYCLLFLPSRFGGKSKVLGKAIGWLFLANVLLALAPVAVPVLVVYGLVRLCLSAYRMLRSNQAPAHAHAPRRARRPRPVFEMPSFLGDDEEDEAEEGGHGH